MAYEKTTWQTGDTVTADKLNHAEQGILENSVDVYVGTMVEGEMQFNLSYNQVVAALQAHKDIKLYMQDYSDDNPDLLLYRLDAVIGTSIGLSGADPYYTVYVTGGGMFFSTDPDAPLTTVDPT